MTTKSIEPLKPVWIKGPGLRKRWDNMSNSAFYVKLREGKIPAPEYPFGNVTPYWRMEVIERFEEPKAGGAA